MLKHRKNSILMSGTDLISCSTVKTTKNSGSFSSMPLERVQKPHWVEGEEPTKKWWITGDTWKKIDARKGAKSIRDQMKDPIQWKNRDETYRCLDREVKKSCRRDKKYWSEEGAKRHKKQQTKETRRHYTGLFVS